jgi:hypothetical protein
LKADANPFDFVTKFLDSTLFLSSVAFAIVCGIAWAIWRG